MTEASGYKRALLKISGEAFGGERHFGFDRDAILHIASEVAAAHNHGHEVSVVVGGGNIIRGADSAAIGAPPLAGDQMGMISTTLNALALRWALLGAGVKAHVMCAFPVANFVEPFHAETARDLLKDGAVMIFAGGTGNPCFTTDSAAALRAVETEADVMVKATQTQGVYDKDPKLYADAVLFDEITVEETLDRRLGVMDAAAVEILGRRRIPIIVLDLHTKGNILKALQGKKIGSIIR